MFLWKECQSPQCPCSGVPSLLPLTLVTVVSLGLPNSCSFLGNWCGTDSGKSLLLLSLVLVFGLPRRVWPRAVWNFLSYKMAFPFYHLQNLSFIHVNILDLCSWDPVVFNGLWFILMFCMAHIWPEGVPQALLVQVDKSSSFFLVLCCFMCGQQELQSSHAFPVPARD